MRIPVIVLFSACLVCGWLPLGPCMAAHADADAHGMKAGQWTGGAGLGFLGNTPDGVLEFGLNGHVEYVVAERFSIGPLAQYAGAGNDFLFGLSAQAKYWWDIPGSEGATKFVLQGGLGFVRAGITDTDSGTANTYGSFLIPIGIGIDHAVSPGKALTADFLLNFTSLGETVRAGGREFDLHTNIMPAFYLGVRF
ncbi:MAG TPA: hypothetical protein VFR82_10035 [Nitrospira sp.]|nr:hypothetical protein [Nitrospira sp.]